MGTDATNPKRDAFDVAVQELTGRADRHDPVVAGTGGPAGNARLTAWTGLVLLVLLAIEGVTLLDVGGLISWHLIVGLLLVPPALLKVGTTGWRIVRYYTGDTAYRQAGPPQVVLRVVGPLVVLFTLLVLGTGILLTIAGPSHRDTGLLGLPFGALSLHKASFIAWLVVMTVHVLARTVSATKIVTGRLASGASVPGRGARTGVLLTMAGSSVVLAVLLAGPWITSWQQTAFHLQH